MPLPRAVPVTLTAAERTTLKKRARGAKTAHRDRRRAQIVLAAARGRRGHDLVTRRGDDHEPRSRISSAATSWDSIAAGNRPDAKAGAAIRFLLVRPLRQRSTRYIQHPPASRSRRPAGCR